MLHMNLASFKTQVFDTQPTKFPTDHEIGRVIQSVEVNQYTAYNGILELPIAEQMKHYDEWGLSEHTHTCR
nr:arylsulfatase [uncultured bacterium]